MGARSRTLKAPWPPRMDPPASRMGNVEDSASGAEESRISEGRHLCKRRAAGRYATARFSSSPDPHGRANA
jgi:hypothetical protein